MDETDTISRQAAIDALKAARTEDDGTYNWRAQRNLDLEFAGELLETIPSAQPDHTADIGKKVDGDCISRQAAIDALDKRFDDVPMELTTEILQLRRDLRERIPSAQPATSCSEIPNGSDDTISRQMALDALDEQIEQCNKALGLFDISPKDEYAIKVERASLEAYKEQLENIPAAQPEQKTDEWIPISKETNPTKSGWYLVTVHENVGCGMT